MLAESALVTGAYGFVGRHMARRLADAGYAVTGIGHGNWSREEWRRWGIGEWHSADVTVESLTTYAGEPNVIIHCAGSGSVAFSMTHPYQDYQRTVATTLSVLEFVRLSRPEARLVLPSSAGVYGMVRKMPIRVDTPLSPVSPYGVHKSVAESLCASYARHFGVRAAIVRLFSVYGIGIRKQLLWDACSKISRGDLLFGGTGEETRDWIHVEDAAALLLAASHRADKHCPTVNGGTGIATPIRLVVEAIAGELGASGVPTFSGTVRPGDPMHYQAEISAATAWGWQAVHEWQSGVHAFVDWFRSGAR